MKRSFNSRRHWSQTQVGLILGGIFVLVVVGGGLIWLIYGRSAALIAASCFLAVAAVGGLLWFILRLLEIWVRSDEP